MITNRSILSISPFIALPTIHGSIARTYHINRRLAEQNRLVFVCRDDEIAIKPTFPAQTVLNPGNRARQLYSRSVLNEMCQAAEQARCEMVLINQIWGGIHGYLASRRLGLPLIFDNHNPEYLRFKRMKCNLWPFVWVLEKYLCQRSDVIWCASETDRQIFIQHLQIPAEKLQIVANGADINRLRSHDVDVAQFRSQLGLRPDDKFLLFYGAYTYKPNFDAIHTLVEELMPRWNQMGVQGKMIIVGKGTPPVTAYGTPGDSLTLIYDGFVDNLYDYVKSADVIVVPLLAGAGTRYKILESIACERPVVSTTIGAEGLDYAASQPFLTIHDDWDAFAQASVKATDAPTGIVSDQFMQQYDWDHIVQQIHLP